MVRTTLTSRAVADTRDADLRSAAGAAADAPIRCRASVVVRRRRWRPRRGSGHDGGRRPRCGGWRRRRWRWSIGHITRAEPCARLAAARVGAFAASGRAPRRVAVAGLRSGGLAVALAVVALQAGAVRAPVGGADGVAGRGVAGEARPACVWRAPAAVIAGVAVVGTHGRAGARPGRGALNTGGQSEGAARRAGVLPRVAALVVVIGPRKEGGVVSPARRLSFAPVQWEGGAPPGRRCIVRISRTRQRPQLLTSSAAKKDAPAQDRRGNVGGIKKKPPAPPLPARSAAFRGGCLAD